MNWKDANDKPENDGRYLTKEVYVIGGLLKTSPEFYVRRYDKTLGHWFDENNKAVKNVIRGWKIIE